MDIAITTKGKQAYFSIKFRLTDGRCVSITRAVKTGLRMNLKANGMRGVLPVDYKGDAAGHVYPVKIWKIIEFNGQKIQG